MTKRDEQTEYLASLRSATIAEGVEAPARDDAPRPFYQTRPLESARAHGEQEDWLKVHPELTQLLARQGDHQSEQRSAAYAMATAPEPSTTQKLWQGATSSRLVQIPRNVQLWRCIKRVKLQRLTLGLSTSQVECHQ